MKSNKLNPFKKIFSLLLLAISFTVKGQTKFMPEKIFTKNILFKEGLSQCVITDIVQDKKGFVWAATYDGLNRFDGQNIKVFRHNPDDDNSISSSRIQKLDADEQNHLYMLTNKGFRIFDCSLEKTIRPKTLSTINPAWFCNESKNTIWLYDLQKGLFLVDNSRFHIIQSFPHLGNKLSESIIDIYKIKQHIYIISNLAEILDFNIQDNSFRVYKKPKNDEQIYTHSGLDKFGNIFITSIYSDLIYFEPLNKKFSKSDLYQLNNKLIAVSEIVYNPLADVLFLTTYGQGLFVFDYKINKLSQFKKNEMPIRISNNYLISMTLNKEGILFVGSEGSGIDIFDPYIKKFSTITTNDSIKTNKLKFVRKLVEDNHNNLFIGTSGNGIFKFNNNTKSLEFINTNKKNDPENFLIEMLCTDNKLWLGYFGNGIDVCDLQSFKTINKFRIGKNKNDISDGVIWSMLDDQQGNVWIGTKNGGLNKIDKKTLVVTQFNHVNYPMFDQNGISTIKQLNSRTLLLGTTKGLYSFDIITNECRLLFNGIFKKQDDYEISIKYIYIDKKSRLWLGTDGNGIIVLDKNYRHIKNFNANNSLKNNVIYAILPQNDSSIWISSNAGIANIIWNEKTIYSTQNIKVRNFDEINGLQSNEFNTGAYCLLKNGDIAFGGMNGFNIFNPKEIVNIPILPEVYISELKVFENNFNNPKSISYLDKAFLKPFENTISIEFNTLGCSLPEKTKYQYQLVGNDKDWIMSGTRNYVSYTNLKSGDYEFRVRASNYDGEWNEKYTSLKIQIATPFYKTWWFILCSMIGIFTIIYSIYRNKIKINKEKEALRILYNKELAQLELKALRAQINPHFLFNSLNSINNFILKNDTKKASRYLIKFSQLVRSILNHSTTSLISLEEELQTIELYMHIEGMRFNDQFSYKININSSINTSSISIPSLLLQPYVENAIWHGLLHKEGEKKITISIDKINENAISIEINDNGIGRKRVQEIKNLSQKGKSFGMQIGEDRLKLIKQTTGQMAQVEVVDSYDEHNIGNGTTIKIIIPAKIFNNNEG
jgi:ligand-binding sensor domain-containing protein